MPSKLRVLHLEDNLQDARLARATFAQEGLDCEFVRVDDEAGFTAALEQGGFDLILADFSLPSFDGNAALELARQKCPEVPFVFLSGSLGEELAIEAVKSGATDYVLKQRLQRLGPAVRRAISEAEEHLKRKQAEAAVRRLEEQLLHAQKMEAIGMLAGGVAHDFNNLLTVINGYTELLLYELDGANPLRSSIESIHNAGQRAAMLTRQLLAFSRRQVLQPRILDLNSVVTDIEKMLRRMIGEDLSLQTRLAPDLWTTRADPGQIEQVLMNLAVNARDAMPNGGQMLIQTANANLDGENAVLLNAQPGAYVLLSVSDTGVGMDDTVRSRIFEPFFTTKEAGKGTGLGLSTVYGIVKQSGGQILVETAPGQGTRFLIYLPRTEAPTDAEPESKPPQALRLGTETVLVVEDEQQVRSLILHVLRSQGYQVLQASNAEEALHLYQITSRPIDLLISDVVMPGMSGRELAEQMRAQCRNLRILLISGYTGKEFVRDGVLEGGYVLLEKPFSNEVLTRKVRELLDAPPTPATVLVVDDDPDIRRYLTLILQSAGYTVIECGSSAEALRRLQDYGRIDVVMIDLAMPEHEEIEVLETLKEKQAKLRIIAMSGAFDRNSLKVAERLGVHATLQKPLNESVVLHTLRLIFPRG